MRKPIIYLALLVSACGQAGDLYLPEPPPPQAEVPTPASPQAVDTPGAAPVPEAQPPGPGADTDDHGPSTGSP